MKIDGNNQHHYSRKTQAQGTARNGDMKSIATRFDSETFDEIAVAAAKSGISFAEQVRIYVEIGLETMKLDSKTDIYQGRRY